MGWKGDLPSCQCLTSLPAWNRSDTITLAQCSRMYLTLWLNHRVYGQVPEHNFNTVMSLPVFHWNWYCTLAQHWMPRPHSLTSLGQLSNGHMVIRSYLILSFINCLFSLAVALQNLTQGSFTSPIFKKLKVSGIEPRIFLMLKQMFCYWAMTLLCGPMR